MHALIDLLASYVSLVFSLVDSQQRQKSFNTT